MFMEALAMYPGNKLNGIVRILTNRALGKTCVQCIVSFPCHQYLKYIPLED